MRASVAVAGLISFQTKKHIKTIVSIFLVTIVSTSLSACSMFTKISVGEMKLSPSEACPANFAKNNCAPTGDKSLLMSKYQPALPIVDGSPRWLDYVGGILADDDKKGTDPATCGMSVDTPFILSDLDINYVPYSISYQNTVQNTANGTASTDLIKALKNIGVSGEVLKQASANIKTTLDRFQTITVKTKADFVVVKLSTSALNKLRAISVPKRLEDCSAHLSSNQYVRLIRGISGYWVKSASEDTTTRNDLTAELNAALTGVISSEQLVSLSPKITSISNSLLNTVSGEHFVIIAMTFYEP